MSTITLSPRQDRLATQLVADGRYRDTDEVVAAALDRLERAEHQRAELLESVIAAQQQAEREGVLTIDDVIRDAELYIEELARSAA